MKIVHVALCGPVTDGWNYQDNMIPKFQVKMGNKVTVIASKWVFDTKGKITYLDKDEYINADGVHMIRLELKKGKNVNSKFKTYSGLYDQLIAEKPECIFVHNISFIDVNAIVKYARNHKVKIFADNHNDFSNSATRWLSKNILHKVIWKYFAQKLEPYVDTFYGVLPARVDFLIDVYKLPKNKVELLVMGADDDEVQHANDENLRLNLRKEYGIDKDDFLIVTGGKIDTAKTQTLLLMEAMKQIQKNNVKLLIFGSVDSSLQEKFNALCDGKRIQYIGWIDAIESYKFFSVANLVVFPGRHSVFWEQVTGQGIPMVCKYWDGTTHIDLGGNVQFLYDDSVGEIQKKILEILEIPELYEKMKKVASDKGLKYFSYKNISKRSLKL